MEREREISTHFILSVCPSVLLSLLVRRRRIGSCWSGVCGRDSVGVGWIIFISIVGGMEFIEPLFDMIFIYYNY